MGTSKGERGGRGKGDTREKIGDCYTFALLTHTPVSFAAPLVLALRGSKVVRRVFGMHKSTTAWRIHRITGLALLSSMPHLSAEAKHPILLEYTPRSPTHSLAALARRHAIQGGDRALRNWLHRWDGTAASLAEGKSSGRPRVLSRAQVSRHVRAPILAANRAHRAISYTDLLPEVQRKTGKQLSSLERCAATARRSSEQVKHTQEANSGRE